jgi:hypothetical protein
MCNIFKQVVLSVCLFTVSLKSISQITDSSAYLASQFFKEAKALSDKDNGKLLGSKLYGPMLFVDRATGKAIANEQDSAGLFQKIEDVYTGNVPKIMAANTAKRWGGKIWTVILWPLPAEANARKRLMMHELFHQLQLQIGLPMYSPQCDHLDKFDGRLLLKLELEALRKIVNEYPKFSKADLANAIALRRYRYSKYPNADSLEHSLEFNEGLATYTGFVLNGLTLAQQKKAVNEQIDDFYRNKTFVRSLGYITGYTYGFLLSNKKSNWLSAVTTNRKSNSPATYNELKEKAAFEDVVAKLFNVAVPESYINLLSTISKGNLYNYNTVFSFEQAREEKNRAIDAENKRKFVDGPVLELPNENMSFNFDPNEVQVLEGHGPIYPKFTAKAAWGALEVKSGGVLIKDWMLAYLPIPADFKASEGKIKTPGWELELVSGWIIVEGKRKGDFKVEKKK